MLKPAIAYKDEILKKFIPYLYTEDMAYYNGVFWSTDLPSIDLDECWYRYAILNTKEEVIGYVSYYLDCYMDNVEKISLFSFDRGNPIIGKDVYELMKELIKNHHRVEWKLVQGNPAERSYDALCKKFNGNKICLHQVIKDNQGKYRDLYVYEILKS